MPDAPVLPVRDPWPGDPARGAVMLRADHGAPGAPALAALPRDPSTGRASQADSFVWLRDLRALGTDAARLRARALVQDFMDSAAADPVAAAPEVAGARIAAWLGHYDFFAASADDGFRQQLMGRLVSDARALASLLPPEREDGGALTVVKGVIAACVAMPEHTGFLARAVRMLPAEIERQVAPDGMHRERSPGRHLEALQELIEMRALLQAAGVPAIPVLTQTIERMGLALRTVRHGDGGLALFNGTKEGDAGLTDLVQSQAGRSGRPAASLGESGFERLQAGRTLLVVDCGPPPGPKRDRSAHAGTLAFELSVGRDRVITNMGASAAGQEWRDATRSTAAHSTLVLADTSSSELREHGLGRRPDHVERQRQEANGAHWLEASHDGWRRPFGAVHRRRLYLAENGEDVRGEDAIEAATPQPYVLRFHLHPSVDASLQEDREAVLLRLPSGSGWKLRADGARISLEDDIYLGSREPRRSEQIVLTGFQDGPQQVKWAVTKIS